MKLHEFPRHPLTFGPSPLQPLKRLTQHLGGAEVWAKREDVASGLAFGGNVSAALRCVADNVAYPCCVKAGQFRKRIFLNLNFGAKPNF